MNKRYSKLVFAFLFLVLSASSVFAEDVYTKISEIIANPATFEGKNVTVEGFFSVWKNAPGAPPISRSDWVICDGNKKGIYCNGTMPSDEETGELAPYWQPLNVLGTVMMHEGKPYISVISTKIAPKKIEKMVSAQQIILNQGEMMGEYVGVMGVLAKGHSIKGDRMYLIADPSGAIRIGKTKKLYPKGTIMHIKGFVTTDEYGIPMIDQVEVISAKVD